MRKYIAVVFLMVLVLQGCSGKTRNDLKETGNDITKDVKDAARDVRDKIHDATD